MADFKVSQDFEVMPIQKLPSYIISKNEWSFIKRKVGQINDEQNTWENAGYILIGTGLTTVITAIINDFKTDKSSYICWAAFFITTISGILCIKVGKTQKKVQKILKDEVIEFMNNTEERFKLTTNNETGIQVLSASYIGIISGVGFDAKEKISNLISNNIYDIPANNETFGDPHPGIQKKLVAECKVNGTTKKFEAVEGSILRIE